MKMGEYAASLSPELKLIHDLATNRLRPGDNWLHGPWHWLKVARNAELLAKETPGADRTVAVLFGLLHDCERRTDGTDPQHGDRAAAAFAKSLFDEGKLPINAKQFRLRLSRASATTEANSAETQPSASAGTPIVWNSPASASPPTRSFSPPQPAKAGLNTYLIPRPVTLPALAQPPASSKLPLMPPSWHAHS